MAESPRSNKSSTSAFPNAATSELQGLSDHLDKRLNGLSEKIDVVLGELLKLSRETPTLRPLGPPGPPGPGPPGPPGPPGRSNRSSQQSLYSHQSFLSKQSSARGQWTSPRVNKKNMALKLAERSESSICPSETSSGKEYAKMSPKSHRPLSLRGIRAMDLDFARRLHAKEVCQEVVGAEKDMKPFMRLFQQSRADGIWELLDDPRSSIAAWLLSQLLKMMVKLHIDLPGGLVVDIRAPSGSAGLPADLLRHIALYEPATGSTSEASFEVVSEAASVQRAPPSRLETRESILRSFPRCPERLFKDSGRLCGSTVSGRDRIERAWTAGNWARAVLASRVSSPNRTPTLDLRSRFYAVASAPGLVAPTIFKSATSSWQLIGSFEDSPSVSQSFPSELEARVYLEAAGFTEVRIAP
eukprot:s392_g21.t1